MTCGWLATPAAGLSRVLSRAPRRGFGAVCGRHPRAHPREAWTPPVRGRNPGRQTPHLVTALGRTRRVDRETETPAEVSVAMEPEKEMR